MIYSHGQGSKDQNRFKGTGPGPAKFRNLGPDRTRTGKIKKSRASSDQLGPGPNKFKIGPTRTETTNFQRSWTNLDQLTDLKVHGQTRTRQFFEAAFVEKTENGQNLAVRGFLLELTISLGKSNSP